MTELLYAFIILVLLGFIFILLIKISLLHKSAGEISAAFTYRLTEDTNTLIDISGRDRSMRELAAQINEQLRLLREERHRYQQGDMEIKEAVTSISHDLRTPLTAIYGYLELLEREEKSEEVTRYLRQIENRTEALKNLTEELFQYSVVVSVQELSVERLDLVRILEESLLSFYGVMQEKGFLPEINLPEKAVWRKLDSGALNRIFSNIISNAIKYSDGDFCVTMTEEGRIVFSNAAKNLDAVAVGRLFDRFYTVDAKRNAAGGLGLSIARTLVEQMYGTIAAKYEDDRLSICVQFPNIDRE